MKKIKDERIVQMTNKILSEAYFVLVTNILENLNGIAAIGIGIGLMTVVGQCLGAGRKDEAIYYIKKLSWLSEAVIIASCLLVFALTKPITMLAGMEPASAKLCFFMISFITIVERGKQDD